MIKRPEAFRVLLASLCLVALAMSPAIGEDDRPKSPTGSAATQIGDQWIDVTYSRPILRGRTDIFGSGESYGEQVNGRAPVWRVGANVTTRFSSEADLEINGTKVPAGEYSFFIDLKEGSWTAILSKQPHMTAWDRDKVSQGITWGSYGYDSKHDAVRAPMALQTIDMSVDQMSIFFANVTEEGGVLAVAWEDQVATLPFKVAK